jgi:hypothetical protein
MGADDEDSEDSTHPPANNIAHNRIEKRYQTDLNIEMVGLRNCVPSRRSLKETLEANVPSKKKTYKTGLPYAN